MVKTYSRQAAVPSKSCQTRGSDLRVHFKNTFEVAAAIRGMDLKRAKEYLHKVIDHDEIIPFRRYHGGVGRHAQAKQWGCTQGRWPEKSCKVILDLIRNLEASADSKGLDAENMAIWHVQVNRAQKGRRKTFRAHGGIKPYLSSNCHIEIIATEKQEAVPKAALKA